MANEFMHKPRGIWPWLWGAWILLFLVLEGIAIKDPEGGDTLTEQISYLGGFSPYMFAAAFLIFVAWLVTHFIGRDSRIWRWGDARKDDSTDT